MVGLYLASLPKLSRAQGAIAGGALVYAFGFIGSYYYTFLVLFLLWQTAEESDVRHLVLCMAVLGVEVLALAIRLTSAHAIPIYDPVIYTAMSWAVGALSLVLFGSVLIGWGGQRLGTGRLEADHGS
jgi:hypothetical protein